MTRPAADRVKVEWTGTGTGTMTLGSVVSGFQGFPAAINGMTVSYSIEHQTSSEAEAGFGTFSSAGPTLTRVYRTYPTLGGSAVSFSAGTKHVRLTATQVDVSPNLATTAPTTGDDISIGYLEGRSTWLNTATNTAYICTDHAAGAAVWTPVGGSATPVADSITVSFTPDNYNPAGAGTSVEDHLEGIDDALTGGADAVPSQTVSSTTPHPLTLGSGMHANVEVRSHTASVDFEVPTSASAGTKWMIKPLHTGCVVSVNTNVGSVNGVAAAAARIIRNGVTIVEVDSNAGGAPVVLVRGNVIVAPADVSTTKTYNSDDCDGEFRLTSTSTQTFGASSGFTAGFDCVLFRETAGTIILDGVDADYTISGPDVVNIFKVGTALMAMGKAGIVILDAA